MTNFVAICKKAILMLSIIYLDHRKFGITLQINELGVS